MELLYLWVENYGNIIDQEFHFTNDYKINYDKVAKKISIDTIESNINIFDDAFLNVTAIVGKNGSGKSTLFSMLKRLFIDSFEINKYILVLNNGKQITVYDGTKEDLVLPSNVSKIVVGEDNNSIASVDDLYMVVFSNAFSIYENKGYGEKFKDFSLSERFHNSSIDSNRRILDAFDKQIKKIIEVDNGSKGFIKEEVTALKNRLCKQCLPKNILYNNELVNNLNFISQNKYKGWDFVPKVVNLTINGEFIFNNKSNFLIYGISESFIDKINSILFETDKISFIERDMFNHFKKQVIVFSFLSLIYGEYAYASKSEFVLDTVRYVDEASDDSVIIEILKESLLKWDVPKHDKPVKLLQEFIINIDKEFDGFNNCSNKFNESISFVITDNLKETLNKITKFWNSWEYLFKVEWHGLSAGEEALLSIYSNLNSISNFNKEDNLWLLIDEGDLYLHPEWQRKFFNDLNNYLPVIFPEVNIQLFLTSHSPFLVSDLPRENIILLDSACTKTLNQLILS